MSEIQSSSHRRFRIIDEVRAPVTRRQRMAKRLKAARTEVKEGGTRLRRSLNNAKAVRRSRAVLNQLVYRERAPAAIRWLLGATLIYLLVEMAFAAWLIDVMGANSDAQTIHRAEHFGRLISGFAVALLCWPWILTRKNWLARGLLLALVTYVVMGLVYNLERRFINHLVDTSSAEARYAAHHGTFMRTALATNEVRADHLDGMWDETVAQSVPGKAFVGVSAFLVARSLAAREQTQQLIPEFVRAVIDKRNGGFQFAYASFIESQDRIKQQYAQYKEVDQRFQAELTKADAQAKQAWEDYLDTVESRNRRWGRNLKRRDGHVVPRHAVEPTRKAVRERGIPVPKNWNTGDRATFVRLAKQEHVKQVRQAFEPHFKGLPAGLALNTFARHSLIQDPWRETLNYPASLGMLPINALSASAFRKQLYDPLLTHRTQHALATFKSDMKTFADGQKHAQTGKRAYEAMIAPVFALTLSLLGALVHLVKVSFLTLHVSSGIQVRHGAIKSLIIALMVVASMVAAAFFVSTPLTSHPTYRTWVQLGEKAQASDLAVALTLDAVIKAQSLAYPTFNLVRQGLAPLSSTTPGKEALNLLEWNVAATPH